jgi:hypothetical protein
VGRRRVSQSPGMTSDGAKTGPRCPPPKGEGNQGAASAACCQAGIWTG